MRHMGAEMRLKHGQIPRTWICALVLSLGFTVAAAGPRVEVNLEGSLLDESTGSNAWTPISESARVLPGDEIRYRVELFNAGDHEARQPVALGPIPEGTALVEGTATTGLSLEVLYSIDRGRSFSPQPTIVVEDEDGRQRTIPAPLELYTTIKWTWNTDLDSGERTDVSYQVRVR